MSEWLPIESAPKDGTRFVGLSYIPQGLWSFPWLVSECYWEQGMSKPKFIFDGWATSQQPVYWMPLPSPPAKETGHE